MSAPKTPHPPDPDPDAQPPAGLDDAVDARIENADFSNQRFLRSSIRRIELQLCRLTGVELAEATWNDVVLTDCRVDFGGSGTQSSRASRSATAASRRPTSPGLPSPT